MLFHGRLPIASHIEEQSFEENIYKTDTADTSGDANVYKTFMFFPINA